MVLLTWLHGVSRSETWLFLPNLVEVQDVGALCRETRGCFRIVFDSAGSTGVVFGPTLVVGRGVSLFCYFVVLCGRRFSLYCFLE
ncbi:hypothetical protein Taro_019859 [Colocasia esculenta]|uniref:Uncharacterized protein n=1 Tax=Colocasia esculenta TaxID=4460 RepID=A0A843UUX9_COLES|nr:hypothetical protein [Colocasia esculenta]